MESGSTIRDAGFGPDQHKVGSRSTEESAHRALNLIRSGTVEITHEAELLALLQENRPLIVKCGFDPTAPDLHLGHAVLLRKMRQFQDLGHQIVFLIGDFTATIGDPTGRNAQRPPVSWTQIALNSASFKKQVFTILDEKKTWIEYNAEWAPSTEDLIRLMATTTVSQMLERDDFKKRFDNEQPIHLHELVYPILQGFDSVKLKADVELGGTDQKFNLLMGRVIQRHFNQKPQVCITMPIINGLDGVNKMSKSLGNHVGLIEPPASMFAKLMSISDETMIQFRHALTTMPDSDEHPKEQKKALASEIVWMLHSQHAASKARFDWEQQFEQHQQPEMETVTVSRDRLDKVIVSTGLASSNSEANRMIQAGAVQVDGVKATDNKVELPESFVLKLGRNWKRVKF
jgi:tyrosyl-tRNA synthetase